ncbi:hypothetical protein [Streptomyces sp. NPDC051909]|uniref:hypothetical protein n=1 Tax=Streptomyces sp. NPDC051909 TaxID=3154944 RepID=UPI0034305C7A
MTAPEAITPDSVPVADSVPPAVPAVPVPVPAPAGERAPGPRVTPVVIGRPAAEDPGPAGDGPRVATVETGTAPVGGTDRPYVRAVPLRRRPRPAGEPVPAVPTVAVTPVRLPLPETVPLPGTRTGTRAGTEPARTEPGRTDPAPTEPAPTDPASTAPASPNRRTEEPQP